MLRSGGRLWHRHPHVRSGDQLTFGERAADVMRNAFGSWAFVGGFLVFMAIWMTLNSAVLGARGFDRYPYILLNLSLSMMAGLQGALILIAAKRADRISAEQAVAHYAETEKIDAMAGELLELQRQQMAVLAELQAISAALGAHAPDAPPGLPVNWDPVLQYVIGGLVVSWPPVLLGLWLNGRRTRRHVDRRTAEQNEMIAEMVRDQTAELLAERGSGRPGEYQGHGDDGS